MRIAGISIKDGYILDKELLIKLALKTPKYIKKRNALELINKEIKESGLYRENKSKSQKPKSN